MNELIIKYNQLDEVSKLFAMKFIDFLYREKDLSKKDLSEYKKKILKISVWSDNDIAEFDKNNILFNQWETSQW